jgi:predicted membrane metal-binding protein
MALLELLLLAPDLFLSWRLLIGALVVALLCWIVVVSFPDPYVRWVLCTAIIAPGVIVSFRWQVRSMKTP